MILPIPAAPFSRIKTNGDSVTIETTGKSLVLPTGDPDLLPSFNEYVLNSNKLTIEESPWGGLKDVGSRDYSVGSISTPTPGVILSDPKGGNSGSQIGAGALYNAGFLNVDRHAHTITEEIVIENTNEKTAIINDAESKEGWNTYNSDIELDSTVYYSGSNSIKATAIDLPDLEFGAKLNPTGVYDFSQYICIIFQAKGIAGRTGRFIIYTDKDNWASWDVTYSGGWDTFTLKLASPYKFLGNINLNSIDYFAITMKKLVDGPGDVLYVDNIRGLYDTPVDIEIRTPDYLYNNSHMKESSNVLINNAESTKGWNTYNSDIELDSTVYYSGSNSIKATAIDLPDLEFGAKLNPTGVYDFSQCISIIFQAKGIAGRTGRFIIYTDKDNWASWDVTYSGGWDTFTLKLASPDKFLGNINLKSIDYFAITMKKLVDGPGDVLYIDEIQVQYRVYSSSFLLQCWDGTEYINVRSDKLAITSENVTNISLNLKYLNKTLTDSVYGVGKGIEIFPIGIRSQSKNGTTGTFVYSHEYGIKSRIGVRIRIPTMTPELPNFNKIRLKFIITYSDESLSAMVPPLLNDIIIDYSGNQNEGDNYQTTLTENRFNKKNAFSFDGVDDYIKLPSINASRGEALQHAETPCDTPTYDGSGQAVHPSVLYFEQGWNGYKYWMAMTPYPLSDDKLENPSILASNDGDTWVVPAGVTNPLYPLIAGHNNDADLVYDPATDSLRIYWLDTRRASECAGYEAEPWYNHQFLMMISSHDGVNWSDPIISIDWDLSVSNLEFSPSIIRLDDIWMLYTIESYVGRMRTSTDGINWSEHTNVDFGDSAWHITVRYIPSKSEYWAILSYPSFPNGDLRFVKSSDGITFTTYPSLLLGHGGSWDTNLYRTTFLYNPILDKIDIWYTGATNSKEWHVGRITTPYKKMLAGLSDTTCGLTLAAWVYPDGTGIRRIFNKYSSQTDRVFTISLNSDNKLFAEFWSYNISKPAMTSGVSTVAIPQNEWSFVAITFDGNNIKIYIDGQLDKTTPVDGTQLKNSTVGISIGKYDALNNYYWSGKLSDIQIYNRTLFDSEIAKLHSGIKITTGLAGHWGSNVASPILINCGSATYEFENSTHELYGLHNIRKPWVALHDRDSTEIDFFLRTSRQKSLEFKKDETGTIHGLKIYPGNGVLYHGKIIHCAPLLDSDSNTIPDCLEPSVEGSIAKFLEAYDFMI